MKCLNDAQIQAVVDNEAADDHRTHTERCRQCSERVNERRALTTGVVSAINVAIDVPPALNRRIESALARGISHGATRLRGGGEPSGGFWRAAAWSGGAVAAATLVAVVVVAPLLNGPAMLSAAEILARSASRLAEQAASGVELLEYELILDGVPREMMPDQVDGAYRVTQIIDHVTAGRYRVTAHDPAGTLVWAVTQDPVTRRRVMALRVDGQPYRMEFDVAGAMALSPPEMERLHMQACVAMMQASGTQQLELVDSDAGRQYRIAVPQLRAETANALWDLSEATALIDARDYHIVEFAVKGTFLKRPYSVSYRLLRRTLTAQADVRAGEFDIPVERDALALQGEGSAVPVRDALVLALRELQRRR